MYRHIVFVAALAIAAGIGPTAQTPQGQADAGDRVVLITLDGARTEELFGGLDLDILRSTLEKDQRVEDQPVYKRFWAESPEERRSKLMPFFWNTLMKEHGSIAGNAKRGSTARLTNTHRFSYPGYSEILVGEAHDDTIKSNDPVRNPYETVLEGLRSHLGVPASGVATFGSWDVFDAIVEHTDGATHVNAGHEPYAPAGETLNALLRLAPSPWETVRYDAYTHGFAMAYLATQRPRVLYLALGETDDWAHSKRYDRVLMSLAVTDELLGTLWTWLQSQDDYRGRTHLILTTDHGRGHTREDWHTHGAKVEGAQEVWIAFVSPRMTRRGEWTNQPPIHTNQVAATMAGWLGLDWPAKHPKAGKKIE